jgi:HAMP domain-containing protein
LWDSGNQIKAHGEMTEAETEELTTSLTAIRNTHPMETDIISKQMQKQLDTNVQLRRDLEEKATEVEELEDRVNRLREWINAIKDYAQQSVAGNKPDDNLLKMFVAKNFEYFTIFAPQPVNFSET